MFEGGLTASIDKPDILEETDEFGRKRVVHFTTETPFFGRKAALTADLNRVLRTAIFTLRPRSAEMSASWYTDANLGYIATVTQV